LTSLPRRGIGNMLSLMTKEKEKELQLVKEMEKSGKGK